MRLLVFDEELIAGGVETLRFNLLPELARSCELVVWVLPNHVIGEFSRKTASLQNLIIEPMNWPRGTPRGIAQGFLARIQKKIPGSGVILRTEQRLRDWRIRALAQQHNCACLLTTCVFNQPVPATGLPVFGFVCDINPAIPPVARESILRWVREADGIFAISEFTRDELRRIEPECASKIHAVPLAASQTSPVAPKPPRERLYDFFCPAAANPHKNHLPLFRACLELAGADRDFRLVVSGPGTDGFLPGGAFSNPQMEEARQFLQSHMNLLGDRVKLKGQVAPEEVDKLYAESRCIVLPSAYEGFGLPLAEAIRRGIPVICSDIAPFREQLALYGAGNSAQLVPAGDARELAKAMRHSLDHAAQPVSPEEMAARISRWTWSHAARRCLDILSSGFMNTSRKRKKA